MNLIVEFEAESGAITRVVAVEILEQFVEQINCGVDVEALANLPAGEYKLSELPQLRREVLSVVDGRSGEVRNFDKGALVAPFDWKLLRALREDASRYVVQAGVVVSNPAWQEGTYVVAAVEKPAKARRKAIGQ